MLDPPPLNMFKPTTFVLTVKQERCPEVSDFEFFNLWIDSLDIRCAPDLALKHLLRFSVARCAASLAVLARPEMEKRRSPLG